MTSERNPPPPAESDTLIDVLNEAASHDYTVQLIVRDPGVIECGSCHNTSPPSAFDAERYRRLEGSSDAADMLLVAWTTCPVCGANGTVTLGYGPNATSPDVAVLAELDVHAADPTPDPKSPPVAATDDGITGASEG